jgi:hypothetical protein
LFRPIAGHRADFGERLLLGVEPPFQTGAGPSLETQLSLLHQPSSDRPPWAGSGRTFCLLFSAAGASEVPLKPESPFNKRRALLD